MKPKKKSKYIPIKDAAHIIGVLESDLNSWISEDGPKLLKDYMGRLCIPEEYVTSCINKPNYKNSLLNMLSAEKKQRYIDEVTCESQNLKMQRLSLVDDYYKYIKDLENLHSKYLNKFDIINSETALTAAYILFFKVISLLYLMCDSIKSGRWFSGSFLREIDETLDVAHYFVIMENTDSGKKHLKNWFRANETPKHQICRDAISKWEVSIDPNYSEDVYSSLKNELYHKKSKWIHPTINLIRELFIFNESDDKLSVGGFDYSICKYERKLFELTRFFESSIWSAYQGFLFCFHDKLQLEEKDIELILNYNRLFERLDAIEW